MRQSVRLDAFIWALRLLMFAVFVPAGVTKLAGTSMAIREFQSIGLGQWFRYFTGLLQLGGGVLATLVYLQRHRIFARLAKS